MLHLRLSFLGWSNNNNKNPQTFLIIQAGLVVRHAGTGLALLELTSYSTV